MLFFCEVTDKKQAVDIAEYCWSEIKNVSQKKIQINSPDFMRAIHSLRFLKDAFRSRLYCIKSFHNDLTEYIHQTLKNENNLLLIKLSVEAIGLIEKNKIDLIIIDALKIDNKWISETALKSCRHLAKLSPELTKEFKSFISSVDLIEFFRRQKEFMFSFKLSDGFSSLYTFCKIRTIDLYLLFIGLIITIIINYEKFFSSFLLALFIYLLCLFFYILGKSTYIDNKKRKYIRKKLEKFPFVNNIFYRKKSFSKKRKIIKRRRRVEFKQKKINHLLSDFST